MTGVNSLQLRVYAPTAGTTDTAYGLYLYSAVSGDTTYSYATLKGCLTIEPNQSNFREGLRIKSYGNWATIALCGADNTAASGTFMEMSASDGPHYGANVKLPNADTYKLKFTIHSPEENGYLLHTDAETGPGGSFDDYFGNGNLIVEHDGWEYIPQEW